MSGLNMMSVGSIAIVSYARVMMVLNDLTSYMLNLLGWCGREYNPNFFSVC